MSFSRIARHLEASYLSRSRTVLWIFEYFKSQKSSVIIIQIHSLQYIPTFNYDCIILNADIVLLCLNWFDLSVQLRGAPPPLIQGSYTHPSSKAVSKTEITI